MSVPPSHSSISIHSKHLSEGAFSLNTFKHIEVILAHFRIDHLRTFLPC